MALAAAIFASGAASAAEPLSALLACRKEPDAAKRLQCFDAAAAEAERGIAAGEVAPPAAVLTAAEIEQRQREDFGKARPAPRPEDPAPIREIETTLAAFSSGSPALGVILTLADGSVWEQTDTRMSLVGLKAGETVTVRRASLGSYFLKVGTRPGVRARRLR